MASPDLVDLPCGCSAKTVANVLGKRFDEGKIYTWLCGSPRYDLLIAVNPYHLSYPFDSAATAQTTRHYYNLLLSPSRQEAVATNISPHIFAIIAGALDSLLHENRKQSIVFIGESGAGKTFATSQCLRFLKFAAERYNLGAEANLTGSAAIRARRRRNKMPSSVSLSSRASVEKVEEKLVEACTLLEALGNARTLANKNSSRFGKWVELVVDMSRPTELLKVNAATVKCFLLEAGRVVAQREGEAAFHVFYYLAHHKAWAEELALDPQVAFRFLRHSAQTVEYNEGADRVSSAMEALGFAEDALRWMFQVVAAVLHLGNVCLDEKAEKGGEGGQEHGMHLQQAARLLDLEASDLLHVFKNKTLVVKGEKIVTPVGVKKASALRDAFAKYVYKRLFHWAVGAVNEKLVIEGAEAKGNTLGLLDIFGFECLADGSNSLEQLCINYTNEAILQNFNKHVHEDEDEFYELEQIRFTPCTLPSNESILGAIQSVFDAIQEQAILSDVDASGNKALALTKEIQGVTRLPNQSGFIIQHSAGSVTYACEAMVSKNREEINSELYKVLQLSEEARTRDLLEDEPEDAYLSFQHRKSHSKSTLTSFRSDLGNLLDLLRQSSNRYVHCIKSNSQRLPNSLDDALCQRQLVQSNLLSTLHARQAGFPYRLLREDFLRRYSAIIRCGSLQGWLNRVTKGDQNLAQVGQLRVFLKSSAFRQIEDLLEHRPDHAARTIQSVWGRWHRQLTVKRLETFFEESEMKASVLKGILATAPRSFSTSAKLRVSFQVLQELERWESVQSTASNKEALAHFARLEALLGYLPPPALEAMKKHLKRTVPAPKLQRPAPSRQDIIKRKLIKSIIRMERREMEEAVAEARTEQLQKHTHYTACVDMLAMEPMAFTQCALDRARRCFDTKRHVEHTFDLLRYLLQDDKYTVLKQWLDAKNRRKHQEQVSEQIEKTTANRSKQSVLEMCRRSRETVILQEETPPVTPLLEWSQTFEPIFVGLDESLEQELFLLISSRMEGGDAEAGVVLMEVIARRPGLHQVVLLHILKQLKGNPNGSSVHNGLLLLSQTVGCFPITDEELFRFILVWFALHLTFQEYKSIIQLGVLSHYRSLIGIDRVSSEQIETCLRIPAKVLEVEIPPIPTPSGFVNVLAIPVD